LTAVSALEVDTTLSSDTRELMRVIRGNVDLETRLIDDLLDLTRISKGKLVLNSETVDLHTLIQHTLEVCEHDVQEKGIQLSVQTEAKAHHVDGDPARLQQILWNILKNAIKFTPPDGSISIRSANPSAGRVQLQVTDSGAGIDPKVLPDIFNAFEQGGRRVTSRYGGLGLGLAIAKTLVEVHGGRISATSQGKGHGATFTVDLPVVSPAPSGATTEAPVAAPTAPSSKVRILLVEDHQDTARVMARLLKQLKYEVETAENIALALKLASTTSFDLVISDLGLPDGSGNDLMRQLRAKHGLRGIALTGWGMEDDMQKSKEAGFERHLTKPVDFQSLQVAIREVVGSEVSGQ
jgi:CheY-like chemotaxis protein